MENPIDISIVIVNYNVKDFLLQCLRSIVRSATSLSYETIVADNNSTDGSVAALRALFPEVRFIEMQENIGFGRANNAGFEIAKGKYVLILNPDTVISEDTLDVMYDYMESHPETGISGCKVLNPDGSFQLACRRGFPTPWAAFCKLFGLQALFPGSPLFGKYNQTFRSTDETYNIDSLIGAFMFVRRDVLSDVGGFDPQFFMYGEDIDLCYRISKAGHEVAYVHTTSIIHFKGESTKRSSINELKHFYEAMQIFVSKHYGASGFFLFFLKAGIRLRKIVAHAVRHRRDIAFILLDMLTICLLLPLSSYIRWNEWFPFPDYAYPTVFICLGAVLFFSMFSVGEYFESRPSVSRNIFGHLITFFFLSSLTYFFKDYAFSRGILLIAVALSIMVSSLWRLIYGYVFPANASAKKRRVVILGLNAESMEMAASLSAADETVLGYVLTGNEEPYPAESKILGHMDYLPKILNENDVNEVIIADTRISKAYLLNTIFRTKKIDIKFHPASGIAELKFARVVSDISDKFLMRQEYKLTLYRYKFYKRLADIGASFFFLTIGLPMVYLFFEGKKKPIGDLIKVLNGKMSFVGTKDGFPQSYDFGKPGYLTISDAVGEDDGDSINRLNNFYLENFSFSLDLDIFLKYIFRKR